MNPNADASSAPLPLETRIRARAADLSRLRSIDVIARIALLVVSWRNDEQNGEDAMSDIMEVIESPAFGILRDDDDVTTQG